MEKLSYRDHVHLAYSSRKSFGKLISSPKIPCRNQDVDFSDVFGGPPRCSTTELRHSLGETTDSFSFRGGEETQPLRNSWSPLSEKPVFDEDSPIRRRQLGGDFFDDIFRGDDSLSSTPRKHDRNPFSSTPASQTSSPARPVPPKFEPFVGWSPLPAQRSLSSKQAKGIDHSAFSTPCRSPVGNKESASNTYAFPSSPRTSLIRVASQTKLRQDDSRYDSRASYRQSPLSHEFSISGDGPSKATESARQETGAQFAEDRCTSEVSSDSSQFHFSIYKWASKGVTLMMPYKGGKRSNSKERGKNESIVSGLPAPILQGVNLSSPNENMSTSSTSYRFQYDNQDNGSSQDLSILMKDDIVEEPVLSKPEPKHLDSFLSDVTEEPGRNSKMHSGVSGTSPHIGLCKHIDKEECQPKLNHLDSQLNDCSDEPGKEIGRPAREEVGMPVNNSSGHVDDSIKVKKRIGGKVISNHAKATIPSSQVVMLNSEDKMHGNSVKGKVKEFIKIFNQEASPKLTCNVDSQGQSSRRKDLGAFKVGDSASLSATKADGKDKMSNGHSSRKLTDTPVMVDQFLKQTEMARVDINSSAHKSHDSSSEKNSISESFSETTREDFEAFGEDLHVSCLAEQLPEDQQKRHSDQNQDEIQISDAKIRQWSHGKEGNIRSLLSTLQYVLWPDSGWKPVPLVDIIEGVSVKRAYQKALLCLHPDKLQQKGAAIQQKYIAEKVFDMLQVSKILDSTCKIKSSPQAIFQTWC